MKLRLYRRHSWHSLMIAATLFAFGDIACAAAANDDANEASGGCDLTVTPAQSATIGAVALTGLVTLSLLQRRRRD